MDVTLKQLRYFVAVAEHLSFTAAARAMHVSQPALSVQVRRLEAALGVALVHRTSRSVELTAAGRDLHGDLVAALGRLDRGLGRARSARAAARPRLAYTASVAYEALPAILDHLEGAGLGDVDARMRWCAQAVGDVRTGAADVALVREFDGEPGLRSDVIRREPLAAFAATGHPLAGRSSVAIDDLRGHTILVVPEELAPGFHALAGRLCARRGFAARVEVLTAQESREPLLAHLRRHPEHLFLGPASSGSLAWEGVVAVPVDGPGAHITLCMVTPAGGASAAGARAAGEIRRAAQAAGWLDAAGGMLTPAGLAGA